MAHQQAGLKEKRRRVHFSQLPQSRPAKFVRRVNTRELQGNSYEYQVAEDFTPFEAGRRKVIEGVPAPCACSPEPAFVEQDHRLVHSNQSAPGGIVLLAEYFACQSKQRESPDRFSGLVRCKGEVHGRAALFETHIKAPEVCYGCPRKLRRVARKIQFQIDLRFIEVAQRLMIRITVASAQPPDLAKPRQSFIVITAQKIQISEIVVGLP